jgi:hypothetical protein
MTDNILIAIGILLLILVIFLVPLIIQARRTVKGMAQTLEIINRDLPAIMKNLDEISTNLNWTTATVRSEVAELSMTIKRVQGVLGLFLGAKDVLSRRMSFPLVGAMTTAMAVFKGISAFISVFKGASKNDSEDRV